MTYLDAAVVAPVNALAAQALAQALADGWADPRRLHRQGRQARLILESARAAIASVLGARTEEVSFTGSYESAVHAAVLGVRQARRRTGSTVVTSAVEHSAVLQAAAWHPSSAPGSGLDPDPAISQPVLVDSAGRVAPSAFATAAGAPGVVLAGLQAANAEVGTVQPVADVSARLKPLGVPLLMDATAAAGHIDLPAGWDILVADPRSWGAPGGIGILVVRAGTRWVSPAPPDDGTEAVAGAVSVPLALAAAVALEQAHAHRREQDAHRRALKRRIQDAARLIPGTDIAGLDIAGLDSCARSLPHVLTFSSLYVDGEAVVGELDRRGFAVGSGSACTASTLEPSHVLAAMGMLTHGNIRIGLPAAVPADEVERFCAVLPAAVAEVRSMLGVTDV